MTTLQGLPAQVYTHSADAVVQDYVQACTPARALPDAQLDGVLVAVDMLPEASAALRDRAHTCLQLQSGTNDTRNGSDNGSDDGSDDDDTSESSPRTRRPKTASAAPPPAARTWIKSYWLWGAVAVVVVVVAIAVYVRRQRAAAAVAAAAPPPATDAGVHRLGSVGCPEVSMFGAPRSAVDDTSLFSRGGAQDGASAGARRVLPAIDFE